MLWPEASIMPWILCFNNLSQILFHCWLDSPWKCDFFHSISHEWHIFGMRFMLSSWRTFNSLNISASLGDQWPNGIILISTKLKGGILVSPCLSVRLSVCPSVYLSIHPPVCPSVCSSVCRWTESCPLCIFINTCWIHFIFTYLIKQLLKMCCM